MKIELLHSEHCKRESESEMHRPRIAQKNSVNVLSDKGKDSDRKADKESRR